MSALIVGDVITDIIVMPEGPIVRGSDRRATIRQHPGGSAANLAVWLAHFGAQTGFAGRVAVEDVARWSAHFRERGVRPLLAGDPVTPSGVLISIIDADGERSFLTDRGANLNLSAADLPVSLLDGVRVLVVSGYCFFADGPREAVLGLIAMAAERGIAAVVDPASEGFLREVGADAFLGWTRGMGTILANADEALALTGSDDPARQVVVLGESFGRVVLKRGAAGAMLGGRQGVAVSLAAPVREMVDSTGAGDAFAAAFIAAELRGEGAEASLAAAVIAGADAVTRIGGQPGQDVGR